MIGTNALFSGQITLWLWFTVLFANFAEAVAEGRGKAQADALRRMRTETTAKLLANDRAANFKQSRRPSSRRAMSSWSRPATSSRATARSSKASPRSTNRRSPAKSRPSSAKAAATARR